METAPLKCDIIKNMEIKDEIITANGKTISIPEDTKKHLSAHPDVLEFLEEAISKTVVPEKAKYFEGAINLGRIIGESKLIETEKIMPNEKTTFAFRLERKYPSRVIKNEKGMLCDSVTIEIKFDNVKKEYYLSTAYVGFPCPYEPFYISDETSDEFKQALDFWCKHALVYDSVIMDSAFEASWDEVLKKYPSG
ncbi:MAG: hypothetical protein UW66_C0006G0004 [Candidatus Moranbacteria bacterium GW2011_GWF1_44_4]|nr:MAG: hypothetical protein UW66_C0006G0004 [Candidatus Moranbacteria bacterium GW2011_GWF1_44_4]